MLYTLYDIVRRWLAPTASVSGLRRLAWPAEGLSNALIATPGSSASTPEGVFVGPVRGGERAGRKTAPNELRVSILTPSRDSVAIPRAGEALRRTRVGLRRVECL